MNKEKYMGRIREIVERNLDYTSESMFWRLGPYKAKQNSSMIMSILCNASMNEIGDAINESRWDNIKWLGFFEKIGIENPSRHAALIPVYEDIYREIRAVYDEWLDDNRA